MDFEEIANELIILNVHGIGYTGTVTLSRLFAEKLQEAHQQGREDMKKECVEEIKKL